MRPRPRLRCWHQFRDRGRSVPGAHSILIRSDRRSDVGGVSGGVACANAAPGQDGRPRQDLANRTASISSSRCASGREGRLTPTMWRSTSRHLHWHDTYEAFTMEVTATDPRHRSVRSRWHDGPPVTSSWLAAARNRTSSGRPVGRVRVPALLAGRCAQRPVSHPSALRGRRAQAANWSRRRTELCHRLSPARPGSRSPAAIAELVA